MDNIAITLKATALHAVSQYSPLLHNSETDTQSKKDMATGLVWQEVHARAFDWAMSTHAHSCTR